MIVNGPYYHLMDSLDAPKGLLVSEIWRIFVQGNPEKSNCCPPSWKYKYFSAREHSKTIGRILQVKNVTPLVSNLENLDAKQRITNAMGISNSLQFS